MKSNIYSKIYSVLCLLISLNAWSDIHVDEVGFDQFKAAVNEWDSKFNERLKYSFEELVDFFDVFKMIKKFNVKQGDQSKYNYFIAKEKDGEEIEGLMIIKSTKDVVDEKGRKDRYSNYLTVLYLTTAPWNIVNYPGATHEPLRGTGTALMKKAVLLAKNNNDLIGMFIDPLNAKAARFYENFFDRQTLAKGMLIQSYPKVIFIFNKEQH